LSDSESTTPAKTCAKCGAVLPATPGYFNRDKEGKDGLHSSCKSCSRRKARDYYAAHSDRILEQIKTREAANPEKAREWDRTYYQRLKERRPNDGKERYAKRKDKVALYKQINKERLAANRKATKHTWASRRPACRVAEANRRRARKKNNGGSHTAADIEQQYERQKGKCFYCGAKVGKKYHVDHVVPLAKGGSNGPENLVIACPSCNCAKHDKHPMDFSGQLF
jgi:5-methylcytosine-specific restriction endonuclease McrA